MRCTFLPSRGYYFLTESSVCARVNRLFVAITNKMTEPHRTLALPVLGPGNGVSVRKVHHSTEYPGVLVVPGEVTDRAPLVVEGQLHPPVILTAISQRVIDSWRNIKIGDL